MAAGRFVVTRERGPAWDGSRSMREQDGWEQHAAFMDALAAEGFVVLGGPLGDGTRVMLIVDADGEQQIEQRLAGDPWVPAGLLTTARIEPWEVLLRGGEQGS